MCVCDGCRSGLFGTGHAVQFGRARTRAGLSLVYSIHLTQKCFSWIFLVDERIWVWTKIVSFNKVPFEVISLSKPVSVHFRLIQT